MTENAILYKSFAAYQEVMADYNRAAASGPVPYEAYDIETRYGRTHVLAGGRENSLAVVLFHGWNGNAAGIGAEFPFLFDHFRVYMPDIIGHAGKSAPTRPETSRANYAFWATDVLEGLNLTQVIMMGISGGGWMCLKMAAYAADHLKKIVVINPAGLTKVRIRPLLYALPAMMLKNEASYQKLVKAWAAAPDNDSPKLQEFAAGMANIISKFKFQNEPGVLTDAELNQITVPTLLIFGEKDIFNVRRSSERAQQQIPGLAQVNIIPGAGHILLEEPTRLIAPQIISFLEASQ